MERNSEKLKQNTKTSNHPEQTRKGETKKWKTEETENNKMVYQTPNISSQIHEISIYLRDTYCQNKF